MAMVSKALHFDAGTAGGGVGEGSEEQGSEEEEAEAEAEAEAEEEEDAEAEAEAETEEETETALSGSVVASVLALAGNDECVDCAAMGPEWASVSFGVLLCVDCAGAHRWWWWWWWWWWW